MGFRATGSLVTFQLSAWPTDKLLRWLPIGAAVLFAALIGLELARVFWMLVPAGDGGVWQPRPARAVGSPGAPRPEALDVGPLLAAKLFGEPAADGPAPVAASDLLDAPDTNLQLTLRGVFAAGEVTESRALIEPANGDLSPYAVGAEIPGGAKVHSIHADRVLLERGGRLETLRLDRDAPSSSAGTLRGAAVNRGLASNAARVIDAETATQLSQIRRDLLNDPTKASDFLRVQPAQRDGQLRGYRIYPGRKRELFRAAGLRPGDLVTAINGVQLDDPTKGLGLLGDLSQASQINLTVERGGSTQSISVTLN